MGLKDLFKNNKDPKIQNEKEINDYFKLPVLASIPEFNFNKGRGATVNEKRSHSL